MTPQIKSENRMRRWLTTDHLPQHLKEIVIECRDLFDMMDNLLDDGAEKQAGFRHLIEAKDCFVRERIVTEENAEKRGEIDE